MINTQKIKKDFPILQRKVNGKKLVYLDNAATTQKPLAVIEAEANYYRKTNANIHRGIHALAEEATSQYEAARETVRAFIAARSVDEIIFTRNATEAINLVSLSWGMANIRPGDEILLTEMEHHANLLPWQRVAKACRARLRFIPVNKDGELDLSGLSSLLTSKTKLVGLPQVSNVLGTINPVKQVVDIAHQMGAMVLVDAAQSVPHMAVNVADLGADFVVFSGHKMLGPTGIGVLYGRRELLEQMEPFLLGGEMIREVSFESATWHDLPWKFEAGTPNIAGAIGLAEAIRYLEKVGMTAIEQHNRQLVEHGLEVLQQIEGVSILGPGAGQRSGVVTFNLAGVHAHDLATLLDEDGVAIRSGHHCAQPLLKKLGIPAAARASFYFYNTSSDIDALAVGIRRAKKVFSV